METAHLLRSPKKARRLLAALRRAERGGEKTSSTASLRREIPGESED
jgi:PHD/YefM family antitoxin component YafN of YafNO toxin-antitoxin module